MFSVLMSVYKNENPVYFLEAVESIFHQTVIPNEVIIVQDGELTKELYDVCNKIQGKYNDLIKFIRLEKNVGLGKALQYGIENCSFELIARMDTDDIAKPDRFEKQLNVFSVDKDVVLCGGTIEEFSNSPDKIDTIRYVPLKYHEIYEYAKKRNPFNHMTVMFKKTSIQDVGGYLPFYLMEDYYLWVRMLMNNMYVVNLPDVLVSVRADANMFERRGGIQYFISELKLQRKFYSMGFINVYEFMRNVLIRGVIRVLPNKIRRIFYHEFMRNK